MLDTLIQNLKQVIKSRLFPIGLIYFCLFGILIYRLFYIQIVKGEVYEEQGEQTTEKPLTLKSMRGNILDRNGVLLAYNEVSYSVTITNTGELNTNEEKNRMLHQLIQIIEQNGGKLVQEFGIKLDKKGNAQFNLDGNALLRFRKDAYAKENLTEEQKNSTAEEMFEYLRYDVSSNGPKFDISEEYTKEEALKIMSIRFALFLNRERQYIPSTIATNVNEVTVIAIKENSAQLPGVEIVHETHRVYNDSEYFAHMLGYTGMVTSENLASMEEEAKNKKAEVYYDLTDQIGKTGLEMEYEDYLRGKKGSKTVILNENKRVLDTKDIVDPVAGNDLYLTIDSDIQKACYQILEKKLAGILLSNINNGTDVGSKGTSSDNIKIPIYDVYYALLKNDTIDIEHFSAKDATKLEKNVYNKYKNKWKEVQKQLNTLLSYQNKKTGKDISEEQQEYLEYIITMLQSKQILLTSSIDKNDTVYLKYTNDEIGLSEFLQYALGQNWIDLTQLSIGDEYYSTKELYAKLVEQIFTLLESDSNFNKKLYHYLVYSYKLTGKEICLLLFDQGVLKYDEKEIEKLKNNSISAYKFLTNKIRNLEITPGQLALDPCSGSIVVTDVKTGEVIALVTYPSYDNNKLANTIDSDYYSKIFDENNPAVPSMNRPTKQLKAPGSTFKMISAVAALEEGYIGVNEKIYDKVVFSEFEPHPPKCWKSSGHGSINIRQAIGGSCNYFFYKAGYLMSLDRKDQYNSAKGLKVIEKYASMFGLNAKSGIELAEAQPHISDEDSVRSAIGQGTHNYTPVQLSRYVTTIANSGKCFNLTILDKIKDVDGKVVLDNEAEIFNEIKIKKSTWDAVHNGMYKVTNSSEGSVSKLFQNLDFKIAGKTGTAQESKSKPNHALFVSYAPYKDPKISVTVVIPNGYTSGNAAEIAKDVYRYYFDVKNRNKILKEKVALPELNSQAFSD